MSDLLIIIITQLYLLLGITLGWISKDRYPGNDTEDSRKQWVKGYHDGRKSGYETGYQKGREDLLKRIDMMKLENNNGESTV